MNPSWLEEAIAEIGTLEMAGDADNPKILQYAADSGVSGVINKDSVPWCAAFVGAMLHRSGIKPSGKANAKSYLQWGVRLNGPVRGCVVVLNRPPSEWQGHVGFYIGRPTTGRLRILGGNQGDRVCEADFDVARVNQYRWPTGFPIQPEWVGPTPVSGPAIVNPSDR